MRELRNNARLGEHKHGRKERDHDEAPVTRGAGMYSCEKTVAAARAKRTPAAAGAAVSSASDLQSEGAGPSPR
jgi:hypothetical protein